MHYYRRNLGDYAKKAGRLSILQHGVYNLLIDACYDREQFPTEEEAIDWTWASTDDEIAAVRFVLRKFFTLRDGRYVQGRIEEEIAAFHGKSAKNKQIADEREAKRADGDTKRARNVHETSPSVNESSPNQEPRTNNQEPSALVVREAHDDGPAVDKPAKGRGVQDEWQALNPAARLTPEGAALLDGLAGEGCTVVHLRAAWGVARERKPAPERISLAYVVPIIRDAIAGKLAAQRAVLGEAPPGVGARAWLHDDRALVAKGNELGLQARPGETYPDFRGRVAKAIEQREVAA